MATIKQIEEMVEKFSDMHKDLYNDIHFMEQRISSLRANHEPGILSTARVLIEFKIRIMDAIAASPELFTKPKTFKFCGFSFGFRKQSGTIAWKCKAATMVKRLKALYDPLKVLINVTETPNKQAISKLSGDTLKGLGVQIIKSCDVPILTAIETDGTKLVNQLMNALDKEEG